MPSIVFASGYADTFGASPKGVALGNAMTARVNDWSSPYYNIAGLGKTVHLLTPEIDETQVKKNQLAVAYLYNSPNFDIDINTPDGERYYYVNSERVMVPTKGDKNLKTGTIVMGIALDLNDLYIMPDNISSSRVGLLMGINDDFSMMQINDIDLRNHNFLRYGRESQAMLFMGGVGFGFMNDTIGLGLGFNTTLKGDGNILLENVQLSSDFQQPNTFARLDTNLSSALIAGGYFSPGKIVPMLEGLDLGISIKTEKYLSIASLNLFQRIQAGPMTISTEDISMVMEIVLFDYYQPLIVTAGSAYAINNLTMSCDIEFQKWSEFKISGIKKGNYIGALPDMKDIVVIRIGAEYVINENTHALAGYSYQPSFVPNDAITGPYNYLDNDRNTWSLGFSYTLPSVKRLISRVEVVGAYQIQLLTERDVAKDDPTQEIIDIYGTVENYTLINPEYSFGGVCHSIFMGLNIRI